MRYHTHEIIEQGKVVGTQQIAWSFTDYLSAIQAIEKEITPRRLREAILNISGKQWLQQKSDEIDTLRRELAQFAAEEAREFSDVMIG